MPLYFFYTMVQKVQNDQKLKSRGGGGGGAAVSMNFQNLYDFAQILQRHSLIHIL